MNPSEIVDCAVKQCNQIENSIEGCLQVLQKICVKKPQKAVVPPHKDPMELSSKPSYVIAKRTPHSKHEDIMNNLNSPHNNANDFIFKSVNLKLHSILERQKQIIELADSVNDKLLIHQKCNVEKEVEEEEECSEEHESEDCEEAEQRDAEGNTNRDQTQTGEIK